MLDEDLDKTDAFVIVGDEQFLHSQTNFHPKTNLFCPFPTGSTAKITAYGPATVLIPEPIDRNSIKKVSLNLIDQIAWVILHEVFHRLEHNFNFMGSVKSNDSDGHTYDLSLMSDGQDVGPPKEKIKEMKEYRFHLNKDWVNFLNERYGKRIEYDKNGRPFVRWFSKDNARKNQKARKKGETVNKKLKKLKKILKN